jgi:hypothetical protein
MKNIISLIFLLLSINTYAQPSGTINTPKGNSVEYFNFPLGDTASYRAYAANLIATNHWDAKKVAPASGIYNCHAYAWYVSEGGSECWISATDDGIIDIYNPNITPTNIPSNLNEYWTNNGGYHSISDKIVNAKVYYGSEWSWSNLYGQWTNTKDHSAIVDSNMDYFVSKWGKLPRYKHKTADCPYASTSLSYYQLNNPSIIGTSGVSCNNTQRTLYNDFTASNWSYAWNSAGYLNQVGGNTSQSYTVSATSGIGYGYVSLTVTSPSGLTASTQTNIGVNAPLSEDLSFSLFTSGGTPVSYMCANRHYHIYLNNNSGCSLSNYTWSIPSAWSINYTYNNMISVYTNSIPGGMVEVSANTCCGVFTKVKTGYMASGYCGSSYSISLSPNPSSGETTLSIGTASEEVVFDENAEWEIEVFDQLQSLKEKQIKLKGKDHKIQTTGWKTGIYIVRVKYKDEYLQDKLVVQ